MDADNQLFDIFKYLDHYITNDLRYIHERIVFSLDKQERNKLLANPGFSTIRELICDPSKYSQYLEYVQKIREQRDVKKNSTVKIKQLKQFTDNGNLNDIQNLSDNPLDTDVLLTTILKYWAKSPENQELQQQADAINRATNRKFSWFTVFIYFLLLWWMRFLILLLGILMLELFLEQIGFLEYIDFLVYIDFNFSSHGIVKFISDDIPLVIMVGGLWFLCLKGFFWFVKGFFLYCIELFHIKKELCTNYCTLGYISSWKKKIAYIDSFGVGQICSIDKDFLWQDPFRDDIPSDNETQLCFVDKTNPQRIIKYNNMGIRYNEKKQKFTIEFIHISRTPLLLSLGLIYFYGILIPLILLLYLLDL